MSLMVPAPAGTARTVGCGVTVGLRLGTPEVGAGVVAAIGPPEDVTASARDGGGVTPAVGPRSAGVGCSVSSATAKTAIAPRTTAVGVLRLD